MLMLVFLITATVAVAEGQVKIFSVQYATGLNITCEFQNNNIFSEIVSLVITRSEDGVDKPQASVNSYKTVRNHVKDAAVTGNISAGDYMFSTLTIQWKEYANQTLNAMYTCIVLGLDYDSLPVTDKQTLTLIWDDLDPAITATTTQIVDGLTPSLIIECSLSNGDVWRPFTADKLEIFHEINGTNQLLAYINYSSQANATTADNRWTIFGSYFNTTSRSIYLAIKLKYPTTQNAGTYTCDISDSQYVNETDISDHILRSVHVNASAATRPDVSDRIDVLESLQDYYIFACNFEHGLCGLKVTYTSPGLISTLMQDRIDNIGLFKDSLVSVPLGHHLYNEYVSSWKLSPQTLSVETKLIPASRKRLCVSFWYRANLFGFNYLTLSVRRNGNLQRIWSNNGYQIATWIKVQNSLPLIYAPFTLVLEFQAYSVVSSYTFLNQVTIDDILITDIDCH